MDLRPDGFRSRGQHARIEFIAGGFKNKTVFECDTWIDGFLSLNADFFLSCKRRSVDLNRENIHNFDNSMHFPDNFLFVDQRDLCHP